MEDMKEYYAKNADKRNAKKEYDKEWRKNHPDYFKDYKKNIRRKKWVRLVVSTRLQTQ